MSPELLMRRGATHAPVGAAPPLTALTRRASLNALAMGLDYVVKIVVRLVITPILVSGLGAAVYGMWEILQRAATYLSPADGRPTEALRLVIAQALGWTDDTRKQRLVGAALLVWMLLLPLIAALGAVFLWVAPLITQAGPADSGAVRLTAGLLVLTFLLTTLWSVPESVLRGMNLSYKRMGVQAAVNVLGGVLMAGAVWTGLGIAGVGAAVAVRALVTGLAFWLIVRSVVRWFGVRRPARGDVRRLFGMSLWLAAGDLLAKLLLASDVVILGTLVGPATVTTYVLTGYAVRTVVGMHGFTAQAAMPGLGGLLGSGAHDRAAQGRRELLLLTWLFSTVAAAGVLLWNQGFVTLWVGPEQYAGPWVNLLVAAIAVQTVFIRVDAYVIDAGLRPRSRVIASAAAAALTLGGAALLTLRFGIVGLCVGMLAGRMIQTVAYPILAGRAVSGDRGALPGLIPVLRPAFVSVGLCAAALVAGRHVPAPGWAEWVLGVAATAPLLAAMAFAGLGSADRKAVTRRVRTLLPARWRR